MNAFESLPEKERKGSRARCLLLTDGPHDAVARRLTELTDGHAIVAPGRHKWAPRGLHNRREPELGRMAPFLSAEAQKALSSWWLAVRPATARTPNWDIVSQATIDQQEGLILVEAKAHAEELRAEEGGKRLTLRATADSHANHQRIGACIDEACGGLRSTGEPNWKLSRDNRYQMSNRFAWAWKVAEIGIPVVLVYLGFLNAEEMRNHGAPFASHDEWERAVKAHSAPLFPADIWGRRLDVNGVPVIPLIRSLDLPLPAPAGDAVV